MPAKLIFDISNVDLDACLYDREAIAGFNPHRGLFALLDRVIWMDKDMDRCVAMMHVREDAFWADGHIPGRPLMPGVLMVEAGAQVASVLYYRRSGATWFAGFTRIKDVTFRGQVVPGDDLFLLCWVTKYNPRRFTCRIQGLVDMNIVFDGTITGMAFPKMGNVRNDAPKKESCVGTT